MVPSLQEVVSGALVVRSVASLSDVFSCPAYSAPKNKLAGILMTAFAAFGGILFGYDTGTISGIKEMPVRQSPTFPTATRTD